MRPERERRGVEDVVIVSDNPETLDGLQRYLTDAGVTARCARDLDEGARMSTPTTIAFVLFPDDFAREELVAVLASLSERRPHALPVLVTSRPDRFEQLAGAESFLLVPRPVWGWALLDAIRAHGERRKARRREDAR